MIHFLSRNKLLITVVTILVLVAGMSWYFLRGGALKYATGQIFVTVTHTATMTGGSLSLDDDEAFTAVAQGWFKDPSFFAIMKDARYASLATKEFFRTFAVRTQDKQNFLIKFQVSAEEAYSVSALYAVIIDELEKRVKAYNEKSGLKFALLYSKADVAEATSWAISTLLMIIAVAILAALFLGYLWEKLQGKITFVHELGSLGIDLLCMNSKKDMDIARSLFDREGTLILIDEPSIHKFTRINKAVLVSYEKLSEIPESSIVHVVISPGSTKQTRLRFAVEYLKQNHVEVRGVVVV